MASFERQHSTITGAQTEIEGMFSNTPLLSTDTDKGELAYTSRRTRASSYDWGDGSGTCYELISTGSVRRESFPAKLSGIKNNDGRQIEVGAEGGSNKEQQRSPENATGNGEQQQTLVMLAAAAAFTAMFLHGAFIGLLPIWIQSLKLDDDAVGVIEAGFFLGALGASGLAHLAGSALPLRGVVGCGCCCVALSAFCMLFPPQGIVDLWLVRFINGGGASLILQASPQLAGDNGLGVVHIFASTAVLVGGTCGAATSESGVRIHGLVMMILLISFILIVAIAMKSSANMNDVAYTVKSGMSYSQNQQCTNQPAESPGLLPLIAAPLVVAFALGTCFGALLTTLPILSHKDGPLYASIGAPHNAYFTITLAKVLVQPEAARIGFHRVHSAAASGIGCLLCCLSMLVLGHAKSVISGAFVLLLHGAGLSFGSQPAVMMLTKRRRDPAPHASVWTNAQLWGFAYLAGGAVGSIGGGYILSLPGSSPAVSLAAAGVLAGAAGLCMLQQRQGWY